MADQPKAGWLLVFSAVFVFLQATTWFFSLIPLAIFVSVARIPVVIVMLIALGIAYAQYNSLFRHRARSAMRLSMILALCALPWACLFLLAIIFAALGDRERTNPVFYLGVAFVAALFTVQLLAAAAENERWGNLLITAETTGGAPPRAIYSLRDVFTMTTVVAVIMAIASWLVRNGVFDSAPIWLR